MCKTTLLYMAMLVCTTLPSQAKGFENDTCQMVKEDSATTRKRQSFFRRLSNSAYMFVKNFSKVDTNYIEPQKFNYTVMLQNTNTYELYRVSTNSKNYFQFAPLPSIKLGPYIGWRWVFLGYTIDLTHLSSNKKKTEFDLSLYSSQIGIDLFYRKTGNDYKISRIKLDVDANIDTSPVNGEDFDGIDVGIKGFNIYYIFNHRRFSYPAAFSQSTIQRRSCGSVLCGIGYTQHSLNINWDKMYDLIGDRLGADIADKYLDKELKSTKIKYTDISASGGYAYNYVFAHNWLAAISLTMAIGYKGSSSDTNGNVLSFKDFSFKNFNIDGVGRLGIVWNNMRYYSGMSAILHTYNYKKSLFYTNSIFGNINFYFGVNFGRIKH